MAVGAEHGRLYNQEGTFTPRYSFWGQLWFSRTSLMIAQPPPIGRQSGESFGGTVGAMATRSASVIALFAPGGYWGDAPQSEQPAVTAPEPWQRP